MAKRVVFDEDEGGIIASVRPRKGATRRCGVCSARCAWYDRGEGRRRWPALDLGAIPAYVEADAHGRADPLDGLARIGIDEAAYKKGHLYLIVIVDHDDHTGRPIWAAAGRTRPPCTSSSTSRASPGPPG